MARLFISHASANNAAALALRKWLSEQGFDDVFLDIDPKRGLAAGDRWQQALKAAADRCEAVLFVVSPAWLDSKWCLAEFLLAKTLHKRIFGLIVEPVVLERVPAEMTAEWQLCELVGEDRFRTFEVEVGAKRDRVSFREAGLDLLRRGLERAGLDARSFPWPPPGEPNRKAYRGLRALEPQDAAIFFGRDAAIVRGLDRIRGLAEGGIEKVLVVLGASGSGKSSFLRAGLWPRLARDDVTFLPLAIVRPESAVISGNSGLAASLAATFERLGAVRTVGDVKAALANGSGAFGRCLDELAALAKGRLVAIEGTPADPAIVLPLDQAEELFNADGADEAAAFLAMLAGILAPGTGETVTPGRRMIVVATMRSDRYELLQSEPQLSTVKQDLFNLAPIAASEFKSVIEGPAHRVVEAGGKLSIDPALTEQLIADAQGADALPLLGFTLERLCADFGAGGRLGLAEYHRLGGLQGSLEAAVAQAFAEPGRSPAIPADKEAQLGALRAAFIPWLARVDPDTGAPMRRVARLDEIPIASRAMVERLIDARLLIVDRRDGIDVTEVAHESLLRRWPALASWLEADSDDLKLVEGVERAATEWARNGRLEAWLDHRAERLAAAGRLTLREDFHKRLGEVGLAYLAACRDREEVERRQKEEALAREQARLAEIAAAQLRTARVQRIARWALVAMAVAVAIGLGLGVWQRRTNLTLQASLDTRQLALDHMQVNLLAELARLGRLGGNLDGALRFSTYGTRAFAALEPGAAAASPAAAELAGAVMQSGWRLVLSGHEGWVLTVAFSPDGKRIVTASSDKTARIWDAATAEEITALRGHDGGVLSAAYSPDGSRIVTASSDKTARVWDAATGREITVMRGHDNSVWFAAFSPDGKRVVTSSEDNTARIWDAATGTEIAVLRGHSWAVSAAVFSPDGKRVATASWDQTARIWDATTAKEIAVLRGHTETVLAIAFSPDGSRIVTASEDNSARIWDATTAKEIAVLQGHDAGVWSAAFSPDGKWIVTGSGDETARIWDAATAKEIAIFRGHENSVLSVAFSPDGTRIATGSVDRTARVWDAEAGNELGVLPGRGSVGSAAFSPDGSRIVTASSDKTASIWDAATGKQLAVLTGHERSVVSAAFSPDGKRIVTASWDKTARIWDAATAKELAVLRGHDSEVQSARFSPDGSRIVTASKDNTARIWDAATAKEIAVLRGHTWAVQSAAFSPDGSRVATASWDSTGRVWDVATAKEIAVLRGHDKSVLSAAFSPDGSRVVTGSSDRTARIWDAATAQEIAVLRGHKDEVTSVTYSPDGLRIATASSDQTARIWDVATTKEIAVLRGHEKYVGSIAFNFDGSRVVTASWDQTARIWDVHVAMMSTKALLAETCTRLLSGLTFLTREEMHLAGFPDTASEIDVCASLE